MKSIQDLAREAHGPITGPWWDMDLAALQRFHDLAIAQDRARLLEGSGEPFCTDYAIGLSKLLIGTRAAPEQSEPVNVRQRWNIEEDGDDLLVCFNHHEKGDKCEYVRFARATNRPAPKAEPVNQRLLDVLKSVVAWMDEPEDSAFSDAQLAEARAAIAAAEQAPHPAELTAAIEVCKQIDAYYSASLDYKPSYVSMARAVLAAQKEKAK